MSHDPAELEKYEVALAALRVAESTNHDDRADINDATAALFRICGRRAGQAKVPSTETESKPGAVSDPVTQYNQTAPQITANMVLIQAGMEILRAAGKPKSAKLIIDELLESPFEVTSDNAEAALGSALRRRSESHGDVVKVSRGMWGLSSWYSEKHLASMRHGTRTREAMERKREQGAKWGAQPKLNEAQATELKRLIDDGATNAHLRSVFNLSAGSIQNYKRRLENWSPGDPYPPEMSIERQKGRPGRPKSGSGPTDLLDQNGKPKVVPIRGTE